MKKILLFIMIATNILAGEYEKAAKEATISTNEYYSGREKDLLTIEELEDLGFGRMNLLEMQEINNNYRTGKFVISYGLSTNHLKVGNNTDDYNFVEDNNIISLEYEYDNNLVGITNFTNSFGNNTTAIYLGKIKDKNNKGFYGIYRAGIAKGYNSEDRLQSITDPNKMHVFTNTTVLYKDYSFLLTGGIGYKVDSTALEVNIISNAIITSIKIGL